MGEISVAAAAIRRSRVVVLEMIAWCLVSIFWEDRLSPCFENARNKSKVKCPNRVFREITRLLGKRDRERVARSGFESSFRIKLLHHGLFKS